MGPPPIRIADLRRPQLTDIQRLALDHAEQRPVSLTEQAVLAAAGDRTGLDDFGPGDFRDRLALWLAEVNADDNRTALGRTMIFNLCVRYAAARLCLRDVLSRHPEIHDVEIRRPIIVAGLPRSGTTHLLNLISADARLRSLPLWESYEPVPHSGEQAGADGVDPRWARCQREWERSQAILPYQSAMHPMEPDHIHEEIELQGPDFSSYNLEWVARVPAWRDYYLSHDQTPHYGYLKTALKVLQWQRGPQRWVLKSPQHLEQLGPLMATFPDATIVMTHRDPVSVIQSAATMMAYAARLQYHDVDPDFVVGYWSDRIERILTSAVRDLPLIPQGSRCDVLFDQFMADDVGTVARIYDTAGLAMTDLARTQMSEHMTTHARGQHGRVVYDPRADFGVEPADLRRRFGFYFDRFPVRVEVQ